MLFEDVTDIFGSDGIRSAKFCDKLLGVETDLDDVV